MVVEKLSKKQAKPALPAKEDTPIKQVDISEAVNNVIQAEVKVLPVEATMETPKPKSQKERIEQLEAALAQADKNFQDMNDYLKKLEPLVAFSEQLAQRQAQPQAPASPGMMGGNEAILGEVLKAFMGGSGASNTDSEMIELGKQALQSQIGMSKAITDAVISKITGKAVAEVAATISA